MIILDKPYISEDLITYAKTSQHPVLLNDYIQSQGIDGLNLVQRAIPGERIYTASETSLHWVYENDENKVRIQNIEIMKDKALFREKMKDMYPTYYFRELDLSSLFNLPFSQIKVPCILKPTVGFFSAGVYYIENEKDYKQAIQSLQREVAKWDELYHEQVVGKSKFILEEYIDGEEYAIDVYFDENGKPVILNILKHEFSSNADVSDRLYYTSKDIIIQNLKKFETFFIQMNSYLGVKNFASHIEIRLKGEQISIIECNPMRFAGLCCNDLSYYAFGFYAYDYFLNNKIPVWDKILKNKGKEKYAMIVLNKPSIKEPITFFDYEQLLSKFNKPLSLRKFDFQTFDAFGVLFVESDESHAAELDYIMNVDLQIFTKE
ncbi:MULTISPECIES: ATP-grasp domain-containing protein [unclassified Breznakia]|uniref:ATP-grasp domain-containing protein n=1 Tax=unclassified Breznakia TaxID=2623764 RepID=UPI002405550B|nr:MULTISPECIES: ATP-grasp domain-containing protein [unclassified Breznakia]MDF9837645.1 hypothetical protein [Breznakia sp. PFB2-8]MDF9859509.1 hypothetical protein [Breznakia sp. PH5-24]